MEIKKITSDLRLAFPIRWTERAAKREENESAADWAKREGQMELAPIVWAYHTPITREVFEANWRIISATSATLLKRGVSPSIVRVATLALKDAGRQDAIENGLPDGLSMDDGATAATLCREIKRLTLILSPGSNGYDMVPVEIAIANGVIDSDDWLEAEASLVFFTCGYSLATRQRKIVSAESLALALSGSITYYQPLEFASFLAASTPTTTSAPLRADNLSLVPS